MTNISNQLARYFGIVRLLEKSVRIPGETLNRLKGPFASSLIFEGLHNHGIRRFPNNMDRTFKKLYRPLVTCVTDDFTFDQVDHLFGDIGGLIGDALEILGDE